MTFPSKLIQVHMPPLTATEVIGSSAKNLTATGTTRTDAYQLKDSINSFSTVASSTGARLPACENNCMCVVNNYGASTLTVYPFETSGVTIDGATSFQVAANKTAIFFGVQTNWITVYDTSSGGGGGGTAWGSITGTLSDQTDLQTALDAKLDESAVSAFGLTLIDDADATEARGTLGLGTAATSNTGDFATAAQGALADSALQSDDIGVTIQAYDAQLTDIAGLTPTTNNVIIGNGTNLVMSAVKTINSNSILGSGNIQVAGITSGTAVTLTTQTSVDFTGIPSGVKRITILGAAVSTNTTTSIPIIQLGDSGGFEATGYVGDSGWGVGSFNGTSTAGAGNVTNQTYSTGFVIHGSTGADRIVTFKASMENVTGNVWLYTLSGGFESVNGFIAGGGTKTLSDVLTQVRVTNTVGTEQFDAGTLQIFLEY